MSLILETKLNTRIGVVEFSIDTSGLKNPKNFCEIDLLGTFQNLKLSNIRSLADLDEASEQLFVQTPLIAVHTGKSIQRRLNALSDWLANIKEMGAKRIIIKAHTLVNMPAPERERRMLLMGI